MDWGPKSQRQWICREWVGKTGSEWVGSQIKYTRFTRTEKRIELSLEKLSLAQIWGSRFLYIPHKCGYRFSSWLLQCFSLSFFDPPFMVGLFHYIVPFKQSWSSTCWSFKPLLECLSHRTPLLAPFVRWGSKYSPVQESSPH